MDWIAMPFSFPFMRDAALLGLMIALPAGLFSCFLVLRGWSLMGDAVSHAILPGVVLACKKTGTLPAGLTVGLDALLDV